MKNISEVEKNIAKTNSHYGGTNLHGSNILWINGEIDPWMVASKTIVSPKETEENQSVLTVPGASHHSWIYSIKDEESQELEVDVTRVAIKSAVSKWLGVTFTSIDSTSD